VSNARLKKNVAIAPLTSVATVQPTCVNPFALFADIATAISNITAIPK
jgi:hypothetical protein